MSRCSYRISLVLDSIVEEVERLYNILFNIIDSKISRGHKHQSYEGSEDGKKAPKWQDPHI